MQRFVFWSVGLCLAAALGGCPGTLSNPEAFDDGGVALKDAETIFGESCGTSGCHDDSLQAQAGLDLLSPDVAARVVDVNATGIGCGNEILVVAGDPDSSYLFQKILNTPGICGLPMPVVGALDSTDIETIRQWIIDLDGSGGATADGG
jgi:hypothetical protein